MTSRHSLQNMVTTSGSESSLLADDITTTPILPNVTSWGAPEGCLVLRVIEPGALVPWDNPHNMVSQAVSQMTDRVVGEVCLPLLFVLSTSTNTINMLVFARQGLKERVNLCLFYLSLVDLLHMLHAFFCNVDRLYLPFLPTTTTTTTTTVVVKKYGPVFQFLVDHYLLGFRSLSWLSGFVSTVVACDRCVCVVRPLRSHHALVSSRSAAVLLACGTLLCLTGSLVNGSRWSLPCVFDPSTNTTTRRLLTSPFYARNRGHLNTLTLFVATIQPAAYLVAITATTVVMTVKLRKMAAWREGRVSAGSVALREAALTRMLVAVSVLYIVCSVPNMTLGVGIMFVPGINFSGRYYNLTMVLIDLMELTSYINATFNFFIYYCLGSRYRATLRSLLACRGLRGGATECSSTKGN